MRVIFVPFVMKSPWSPAAITADPTPYWERGVVTRYGASLLASKVAIGPRGSRLELDDAAAVGRVEVVAVRRETDEPLELVHADGRADHAADGKRCREGAGLPGRGHREAGGEHDDRPERRERGGPGGACDAHGETEHVVLRGATDRVGPDGRRPSKGSRHPRKAGPTTPGASVRRRRRGLREVACPGGAVRDPWHHAGGPDGPAAAVSGPADAPVLGRRPIPPAGSRRGQRPR